MNFNTSKYLPLLLGIIVSLFLYGSFGYDLERENTLELLGLYVGLFFLYLYFLNCSCHNWKLLIAAGVLFRLVFLFALPNLSQDFYRFIWDGHLVAEGINPFVNTPDELVKVGKVSLPKWRELHQGMGPLSAGNHSNYPPINQLLFWISAIIGGSSLLGSVIVLRLTIFLAEIGVVVIGTRLLKHFNLSKELILLYFLNPLVVIELSGNLHFEGVMLLAILISLWFLQKGNWKFSALFLAISISVKLIPLMFLPLYYQYFRNNEQSPTKGLAKFIKFVLLGLFFSALTFTPFINNNLIENYTNTVALWFNKFEFNASIYYLFREIGFLVSGYNQIAFIGKLLAILVLGIIFALVIFKKNETIKSLLLSMVLALGSYLFLSTTVHPWYLITLIGISIFTTFRFPIVWSLMIVLSYTAYANPNYQENPWVLAIEYLVVFGYFYSEIRNRKENFNWVKPW
ncbi:putative hexosyltransferase [Aegicerativicinus sediminis]|uniref:mannosyltransferase n=1 Tax=Aegicerativicinus sediminis TaxID=2893202 RepID=UPI001E3994A7|nr:mannosyltransferase [Aegicerativicinus sediminis]